MKNKIIYASRFKRFAALFYDLLILISIMMLGTFLALLVCNGESFGPNHLGFTGYLLSLCALYFTSSWLRGGQTLGMKAWRLKLVPQQGAHFTRTQVAYRSLVGLLGFLLAGVGLLWCFVDNQKQTLADRLAKTIMIQNAV